MKIGITENIVKIARTRKNQKSKTANKFPTVIVLETLYDSCGILDEIQADRKKRKQVRDLIDVYMNSLVTKELLLSFQYLDGENKPCEDIKNCVKISFDYNKPKLDSIIESIYKISVL